MDSVLGNLAHGFAVAGTPYNLAIGLVGGLLGTVVGVLPGLGPTTAMALLLPLSFVLEPISALILLSGIWYGSQYGGSTTSILLNMPGEATSVVTAYDGYKMTLKGRGGAALFVAAVGSFVASVLGLVGLVFAAPALANVALAFGPPQYFAITLLGLLILFNITGGSPLKGALMAIIGMALGTVGLDAVSGQARFAFGNVAMLNGIDLASIMMGVYGLAEVLEQFTNPDYAKGKARTVRFRELYPTKEEFKRSVAPTIRGSIVGFIVGLIPGPAGVISTFVSYRLEKRISKHPEQFGEGAIEGVAAPEAANNAVTSASLIPLLSLGLPFSAPAAILLAGFTIHGIAPGPTMLQDLPAIFWGLVASMVIGNVILLILNLPLVGIFASLINIPRHYVLSVVALLLLIGAYTTTSSMVPVWIAIVSGVIAWLIRPFRYDPAPLVLGLVLGPLLEKSFRQSMAIYDGNALLLFSTPLAGSLMSLSVILVVSVTVYNIVQANRRRRVPDSGGV